MKHGDENPLWEYETTRSVRDIESYLYNNTECCAMLDRGWRIHSVFKAEDRHGITVLWERPVKR